MDDKQNIKENGTSPAEPRFGWRGWLALGFALGLSALFWRVFGLKYMETLPSLGAAAFVFALFAAVLLTLGKRAVWNAESAVLTVYTLLLSATFALYAPDGLRLISFLIVLFTGAMAFFALAGQRRRSWREWRVLPSTVGLSARALFGHVLVPLRALGRLDGQGKRKLAGLGLGLLICVPVLAVVLSLLSSADAVFASLFAGLRRWMERRALGESLWWAARTLLLGLLLCSVLYSLTLPVEPAREGTEGKKQPFTLPCCVVLCALDAVYAVFVVIQLTFLFGGAETAAMEGGYAEYARNGFFQLTAVAAVNLAAVLAAAGAAERVKGGGQWLLRVLGAVLLGLTAVILVSAAWRMGLYISVYALSLLRLLTLWCMAFIGVCLVGAGLKLFRPAFRFFSLFFSAGLAGWLILVCLNPAARIAEWNVDAYLGGGVEQMDYVYLRELSPDTLPALERLEGALGPEFTDAAYAAYAPTLGDELNALRRDREEPATWREWYLNR